MQEEHQVSGHFPYFFKYCIRQKIIFPNLIKILLKAVGETKFEDFSCGKGTTAMDNKQISKIQSRLVVKAKIIQSLSACKNNSVNLLDSSNHL